MSQNRREGAEAKAAERDITVVCCEPGRPTHRRVTVRRLGDMLF